MLPTIIQITGIVVVAVGLGLIYAPIGVIALGAGILLFGLAFERSK